MVYSVCAQTLGEAWKKSIRAVQEGGESHFDEDVPLLELRQGLSLTISEPRVEDPIIERWGDPQVLARMMKKFAIGTKMSDRPFTYGELIYSKNGVDQFAWMVERIRRKPETKSATISLLSEGDGSPNLPCLVCLDAKLRKGFLDLHFFFRSQNVVGRQYANLVALADLQARMASTLSCKVGNLSGYAASPHIYEYDYDHAQNILAGLEFENVDLFYTHGPKSIRGGYS
ncbi:thymidylate synthase [Sedimentitalea sp.]|uniref:thymidylate synthase n=1 Tax=Sedimentitalea sp. TaxID=2048915 RepID=UPI00329794C4